MKRLWLLLTLLLGVPAAHAHLGSKDVFQTIHAGPYTLYVTVRPPNVIPGVATVEVRSSGASVTALSVTPLPVTGEASKHPPAADIMQPSSADAAFYTGAVWIMGSGTWQVRFDINGAAGHQVASVPVVAVPVSTLKMQKGMGAILAVLGLFLIVSMAGIVAASFSESRLRPGVAPNRLAAAQRCRRHGDQRRRHGRSRCARRLVVERRSRQLRGEHHELCARSHHRHALLAMSSISTSIESPETIPAALAPTATTFPITAT